MSQTTHMGVGILFMLLAAVLSTRLSASAKWLLTIEALPEFEVIFARYAVHFAIVLAVFLPVRGATVFRSHAPKMLLLRSIFFDRWNRYEFSSVKASA